MSIRQKIQNILTPESGSSGVGQPEEIPQTEGVPEEFDDLNGFSPDKLEQIFLNMRHEARLSCVRPRSRVVSRGTWWDLESYIRSSAKERWGIEQTLTKSKEGNIACRQDDEIVVKRPVNIRQSRSVAETESESVSGDVKAGASAGFEVSSTVSGTKEETETSSKKTSVGERPSILECATYSSDCLVNRRSFCRFSNLHFSTGKSNREELRSKIDQIIEENGIKEDPPVEDK